MAIEWPSTILKPRSISPPFLANRSLSGGGSINGRMQISASDAGVWMCSLNNVPLYDRGTVNAWRYVAIKAQGRLVAIDLPLFRYEYEYGPIGLTNPTGGYKPVPHSDGSYHSDGSGYVSGPLDTGITVSGSAALRATSMVWAGMSSDFLLEPAMIFGIEHPTKGPRWYQATDWNWATGAVSFLPTLREAITGGESVVFDQPRCRMRLATDNEMNFDLEAGSFGSGSVNFIEDL